jgi:hypothetical protein
VKKNKFPTNGSPISATGFNNSRRYCTKITDSSRQTAQLIKDSLNLEDIVEKKNTATVPYTYNNKLDEEDEINLFTTERHDNYISNNAFEVVIEDDP